MRKYFVLSLMIILMVGATSAISFAEQNTLQGFSEEKTMLIANEFIKKVGITYAEKPDVRLRTDIHGRKLCSIEEGKGVDLQNVVEIDVTTGDIVDFTDWIATEETRKAIENGEKIEITEKEAMDIAFNYTNLVGLPSESKLKKVDPPMIPGGHVSWWISWARTLNGYEYMRNWISMQIDPVNGRLLGFYKNWSAPECSTEIKVSKESAIDMGKKLLSEKVNPRYRLGEVISVQPMIVQPNYWWGNYSDPKYDTPTRLAWVIRVERSIFPPHSEYEGWAEVWIDTIDGKVLGGDETK